MRLDRNEGPRQKYGLILNREVARIMKAGGGLADEVQKALDILQAAGVLQWGDTPETEFFAIKLRDLYAADALIAYGTKAANADLDYGREVIELALRSGPYHPKCKRPD